MYAANKIHNKNEEQGREKGRKERKKSPKKEILLKYSVNFFSLDPSSKIGHPPSPATSFPTSLRSSTKLTEKFIRT